MTWTGATMATASAAAENEDWVYNEGEVNIEWVDGSDAEHDLSDEEGEADVERHCEGGQMQSDVEKEAAAAELDMERAALVAPRYVEWREHFPALQKLLDNYEVLAEELKRLTSVRWSPWPEYKLYQSVDQNGDWKVIPLMHTFPAWDPSRTKVVESNCAACPKVRRCGVWLFGFCASLLTHCLAWNRPWSF